MLMTLTKIRKLISKGETETLELKKSTSLLHAAFETVCAFLNGKGGVVLIGVTNDGTIIGQNITDNTRQEIANHMAKLEPPAQIKVDYVSIGNNKYVIVITVIAGNHAPYIYDGRPFLRNQSTTSRMPQHRYEQLIVKRGQLNHSWDEQIAVGYSIKKLDRQEIQHTVQYGIVKGRIAIEVQKYSIEKILNYL